MRKYRSNSTNKGRISIRGVRRRRPDASKIARAVIALALAEAAREAEAQRTQDEEPAGSERGA